MKLRFPLLLAVAALPFGIGTAFADLTYPLICASKDRVFRFTFSDKDSGYYQRKLENEFQQFGGKVTQESSDFIFANFNTKIVFSEFSEDYSSVTASLFTKGTLEQKIPMKCSPNVLAKGPGETHAFKEPWLTELKTTLRGSGDDSESSIQYNHITNLESFDFSLYESDLSDQIDEGGDWYGVQLNQGQKKILNEYLHKNAQKLLNVIDKDSGISILGPVFARDWYGGSGKIGLVLQKGSELITAVVEFDSEVRFNDPRLDYLY